MGLFNSASNIKNLVSKTENVINLVKPHAMQDFGQTTEDMDGLTIVVGINCLRGNLFQARISVAGDCVQARTGIRDVSGISFTGNKSEILEWLKLNVVNYVDSAKAMEKT